MANIPFLNNAYFSAKVGIGTAANSAEETNNGIPRLQVTTATAVLGEFPLAARFTTASDAGDNSGVSVLINSGNDRGLMISAGRAVGNRVRATLNLVQYDGNELVDGITLYQPNAASGGATTGTNVGIGTTSPGGKLDVKDGNSAMRFQEYSNGASLFLDGSNGDFIGGDYFNISAYGATDLAFGYGAVTKMVMKSTGNVGIGTTSPVNYSGYTSLQIDGVNGAVLRLDRADNAVQFEQAAVSTSVYLKTITASDMWFGTDNTERMRILSGGNVGIGTDSPDAKLELSSAQPRIRLTDTITGISSGSTTGAIDFYTSDASSEGNAVNAKIESYADSIYGRLGLRFFTGGGGAPTQAMTINWVGSVGIGTAGPSSKLQVDGGIQMADDTATASATKVGTMRYRTATDEAVPVTGIELITNGDFATDTDWDWPGTSWAIAGGSANVASATSDPIYQTVSGFTDGNKYRVRFEVTAVTNGYVRVYAYVGASGTFTNVFNSTELEIGFYEGVFEFGGTNKILRFYGSTGSVGGFAGSIDNISVVEVTEEDASYADMCMQTGASTYEWVNIVRNTY